MDSGVCPGVSRKRSAHFPQPDLVAVAHGHVLERRVRASAEVDPGPRPRGELAVAGDEIRVQVRLDDVPDRQPLRRRFLEVDLDVPARVHDGRIAFRPDHVGGLGETAEIELFEEHLLSQGGAL